MTPYILTCCSTADLSKEHLSKRDIPYVCFHYVMDGEVYPDDLGVTMSFEEFYDHMAKGASPTTSQVNVNEFIEFFTPFLNDGKDILHITMSSGLSGVNSAANIAASELSEKYPERKIAIVDSLGASSGYGLLMEMLGDLRDSGKSFEELRDYAENTKLTIHHWFFSTDLTSYIRGGRISKTAGLFGTILSICPLLNMNDTGHLTPRAKIRTKKKVISEIVERMKEHAKDGLDYSGKCFISQSMCMEDANAVASLVESAFPKLDGKVLINNIGTAVGTHTGTGTVALFFVGDNRTA